MTHPNERQRQAPRANSDRHVKAIFEDGEFDPDDLAALIDEVTAKEGWNDPAMDAYDALDPRRRP